MTTENVTGRTDGSAQIPPAIYVAVYGTLKKGQGAAGMLASSKFLGNGITVEPFQVISTGWYPMALKRKKYPIAVEVYEITPETLSHLDHYEGYPRLFTRSQELVVMAKEDAEVPCWIYFGNVDQPSEIVREIPVVDGVYVW